MCVYFYTTVLTAKINSFSGVNMLSCTLTSWFNPLMPELNPPQNSLLTSLTFAPDSKAVSATRISLMASS